jgi:hypothetical protein
MTVTGNGHLSAECRQVVVVFFIQTFSSKISSGGDERPKLLQWRSFSEERLAGGEAGGGRRPPGLSAHAGALA